MREAANIAAVAALQPDYMGFIFYPASPRYIAPVSAELIRYIPAGLKTTGVFVNETPGLVLEKQHTHQLDALQLHGHETPAYCAALKESGAEIIKAFGIAPGFDFNSLEAYLPVVDYFLFDTQSPAHGGSGKAFDWQVLAQYPWPKAYFLSGGIGPEHVEALKNLNDERLYALDLNSRFEQAPGLKDSHKLADFFKKIRD